VTVRTADPFVCQTSASSTVIAMLERLERQPSRDRVRQFQTYLVSKDTSCRAFLVPRNWWDKEERRLVVEVGMIVGAEIPPNPGR